MTSSTENIYLNYQIIHIFYYPDLSLQRSVCTVNFILYFLLFICVGTFLGNCEAERVKLQLAKRTASLWSYLNRPEILQAYLNPVYEPCNKVIWPSVAPVSLVSNAV